MSSPPEVELTVASSQPQVSVIICAYNAAAFIAETLESLLAQTWPPVEILVVDDGSTDATPAIVQSFAPRVRYLYQVNAGSSAARNTGIAASCGDLLCFFDADDLMPPDRLEAQISFLQRHPEVGLVFCDYRNFNNQGEAERSHFQSCPLLQAELGGRAEAVLENPCSLLAQENFGITGTLLLRREALAQVPGFEPRLRGCEDFHFYFRLARHTRVGILNLVGMLRRMHADNLTLNWSNMLPDGIRSYSALRDTEPDPHTRRLLNWNIAVCWATLARNEGNRKQLGAALQHQLRAFATAPGWRMGLDTLKGVTRTLAVCVGLHHPDETVTINGRQ